MLAQDLNPIVLGLLSLAGLTTFALYFRRTLSFEDQTVEARDMAPDAISPAELKALLAHGDRANALLQELREAAITHFEADPAKDQLTPAQVFHLGNEAVTRATFEEFAGEFERVLALTRKYKLALDGKTQRAIQKLYFAWDPGGNAISVKAGARLWTMDIRPAVEKLLSLEA